RQVQRLGGDGGDDRARLRPGDDHGGPVVGDRGEAHVQLRPLGLVPLLQPVEHGGGVAGGGGHQVVVLAQPRGGAVVEHHAVGRAHQPVPAGADGEGGEQVGVDAVEEGARVGPPDVDLADGGGAHGGHGSAGGGALASYGLAHRVPRPGEVPRRLALADVLEDGAQGDVRGVHGGGPGRVGQRPAVEDGEGGERHRRVRRAE